MIEEIKKEIERLENEREVKILLAVESGSRAWGFASTDTEIAELLKRKMAGEELKEEPKIEILNEFLEQKIEFYKNYAEQIERGEKTPTESLDELFKETIFEVWK